jgi:4-amino-4-deoxy-L-arabinose transferase-like glycosyltransferase
MAHTMHTDGSQEHSGARAVIPFRAWTQDVHPTAGLVLAGMVALGALLRFAWLGQHSLWSDEAFVVWVTGFRWAEILAVLRNADNHPPLYYLLMKGWVSLAGSGEAALRIPSACASLLCLPLTYLLARRLSGTLTGWIATVLVAVSPFGIMAGQDARMYSLLGCLVVGSTLALVTSVERGRVVSWVVYGGTVAAMVYTHYLGLLIVLAHGVWVLGSQRKHLPAWVASVAAVLLLYLPWLPSLWVQTLIHYRRCPDCGHLSALRAYEHLTAAFGLLAFGGSLFGMPGYFAGSRLSLLAQVIVLLPFLVVLGWGAGPAASGWRDRLLIVLPLGLTLGATSVMALATAWFQPRWLSFLVPLVAIQFANGVVALAARWSRPGREVAAGVLTCGLVAAGLPVLAHYYGDPGSRPYNWRAAGVFVEHFREPGDLFLFVTPIPEMTLEYYIHKPDASLTVVPVEFVPKASVRPALTEEQVKALARAHPRVWLVETVPLTAAIHERLVRALDPAFRVVRSRDFQGVWIWLLEARADRPL